MIKFIDKILTWSRSGREMSRCATWIALFLCVVLAAGLRVLTWHVEPTISRDGVQYVQTARRIQAQCVHPGEKVVFALGTSHYVYSAYLSLAPDGVTPHVFGIATNIVLGSLIPFILGCVAWLLWGRGDLAVAVAALFAVFPKFVEWAGEIQREIPHLFFVSCFFLFTVLYCRKKTWYWSMAIGAAMAMGFVCRYEGAEIFLIWAAVFAVLLWRNVGRRLRIAWHAVLSLMVCAAVIFIVLHLVGFSPVTFLQFAWQKIAGFLSRVG